MQYNWQNKLNSKLYKKYDLLFANDMINWLEVAAYQRNDQLNKKVYKLSPRKGKPSKPVSPGEPRVFSSFQEALEFTLDNYDIT